MMNFSYFDMVLAKNSKAYTIRGEWGGGWGGGVVHPLQSKLCEFKVSPKQAHDPMLTPFTLTTCIVLLVHLNWQRHPWLSIRFTPILELLHNLLILVHETREHGLGSSFVLLMSLWGVTIDTLGQAWDESMLKLTQYSTQPQIFILILYQFCTQSRK
jgi:hypothetical protein